MKTLIEEEIIHFYGSELFSLANLMEDYNSRKAGDGYAEIEISVQLNNEPQDTNVYFTTDYYPDIALLLEAKNDIEAALDGYGRNNPDYNNRSVKYYAGRTNREIARDFGIDVSSSMGSQEISQALNAPGSDTAKLLADIAEYENLDAEYVEFQKKYFYCEDIEYNDQNGRIEKMVIHEV